MVICLRRWQCVLHCVLISLAVVLVTSCGGSGGGGGGSTVAPAAPAPIEEDGTLLIAIQDAPETDLSELWMTVTEIVVETADDALVIFPPDSAPEATRRVNLLDGAEQMNLISALRLPPGQYSRVSLAYDGVFARDGENTVTVLPDAGDVAVDFAADNPITLRAGGLTSVLLDFGFEVALTQSEEGLLMLDPMLEGGTHGEGVQTPMDEFGGTVVSVDEVDAVLSMELTALQFSGDSVGVGELDVQFTEETTLSNGSRGVEGLLTLEAGSQVEVDGVLQGDALLAIELEVKEPLAAEDLNDDGVEDLAQFPDHDTDIDNDGIPNLSDNDDDGDGEVDHADLDNDNDGLLDPVDSDDDGDGIDDDLDPDDDGDGVLDTHEGDNDLDGLPDEGDPDDDNDGLPDAVDGDDDNDGVLDMDDNCPGSSNPLQEDADGDGLGDVCDLELPRFERPVEEPTSDEPAEEPAEPPSGDPAVDEPPVEDPSSDDAPVSDPTPGGESPVPADEEEPGPAEEPIAESEIGIENVHMWALSPTMIAVRFDTTQRAKATVLYGEDGFGRELAGGKYDSHHAFYLSDLKPNSDYRCKIQAMARGGAMKTSGVFEARTTSFSNYRVRSSRPRLLIPRDQLSELRQRARGSHKEVWSDVVKGANSVVNDRFRDTFDGTASHHNPDAMALAAAFLVTDDRVYADALYDYAIYVMGLDRGALTAARKQLAAVAIAYDTLYDDLSSSERTRLRGGLENLFRRVRGSQNYEKEGVEGHTVEEQGVLIWAAIALYDSGDSKSKERLRELLEHLDETLLPVKRYFVGVDGGSANGWYYSTHSREFPYALALMALDNASDKNRRLIEQERTWLEPFGDWMLYGLRGDASLFRKNDTSPHSGFRQKHYLLARFIAGHFENRRSQWFGDLVHDHAESLFDRVHRAYDLLLYDDGVRARSPQLPTSRWFRRVGVVMMRESWEPESVVAQFTSSERYTGGHQHLDDLAFAIYYKGGLALDGGLYDSFGTSHHSHYYQRTIAHNSLTVFDPNEEYCRTFGPGRDGCSGEARIPNDGGQIMPPIWGKYPSWPRDIDDLLDEDAPYVRGGIPIYEDTEEYTYSLGRGGPSYNEDKVRAVDRHFVFLKSVSGLPHPVMVVFDYLDVRSPRFRKTYHLHGPDRIDMDGDVASVEGRNIVTGERGILYQRTLLPRNVQYKRLTGGDIFEVDGRRYPPDGGGRTAELEESRLEVIATDKSEKERFLHVLYATDLGESNPSSSRVSAAGMYGAAVKDWIVLFADKELSRESTSYTARRPASHLLCGMRDSRRFEIRVDGKRVTTVTSSAEGTLRFDLDDSGEVDVKMR